MITSMLSSSECSLNMVDPLAAPELYVEAEALAAIYGDALAIIPLEPENIDDVSCVFVAPAPLCVNKEGRGGGGAKGSSVTYHAVYRDDDLNFILKLLIRPSYPSTSGVDEKSVEVLHVALTNDKIALSKQNILKKSILDGAKKLIKDRQEGVCILFDLIDSCRGEIQAYSSVNEKDTSKTNASCLGNRDFVGVNEDKFNEENDSAHNYGGDDYFAHTHAISTARGRSNAELNRTRMSIYQGEPLVEKKSVFLASFATVESMDEVHLFQNILLSDKKIARATHNIMAYRFTCPKTGALYHDNDDDGETAAAGRVAEMIRLMDANNIIVVVSRWFGGILLGADRFKFICNSARFLLEAHGYGAKGKDKDKDKDKMDKNSSKDGKKR